MTTRKAFETLRFAGLDLIRAFFGSLKGVAEGAAKFFAKCERAAFDAKYPPGDIRRLTEQLGELSKKIGERFGPAVMQLGKAMSEFVDQYEGSLEEAFPVDWATSETADPKGDFARVVSDASSGLQDRQRVEAERIAWNRLNGKPDDYREVMADRIYICHACGGDYHADWSCPLCAKENRLLAYYVDRPDWNSGHCEGCNTKFWVVPGGN